MLTILPSLAALESKDDWRLGVELRLARLRAQVAAVRSIADHVDYLARAADEDGVGEQLVEEMARLGCRLVEAAGSLARSPDRRAAPSCGSWSNRPDGERQRHHVVESLVVSKDSLAHSVDHHDPRTGEGETGRERNEVGSRVHDRQPVAWLEGR